MLPDNTVAPSSFLRVLKDVEAFTDTCYMMLSLDEVYSTLPQGH